MTAADLVGIDKANDLAVLKIQLDKEFKGTPYMFISSITNVGLGELKDKLWKMLNN